MKLGMNMLLWSNDVLGDDLTPTFAAVAALGYDGVEVPILDERPEPERYAALGRRLDRLGLQRTAVSVCNPTVNPSSADPAVRTAAVEWFRRVLASCDAVGARLLVGPLYAALGVMSGRAPSVDEWRWGVDTLRQVSEIADGFDVTLAIEPLNRFEIYLLNTAADGARFVRQVEHPRCRLLYDTFHAHIEEKSVTEAVRAAGRAIGHVHISENDRGTPGTGQVRWDETFAALAAIEYDGWLTVEAFGMRLPALAAATCIWRRTFTDELALARDALRFLRGRARP